MAARYVGRVFRPPSEHDAFILQATVGCSWNACAYCDMYRDKPRFKVRGLDEVRADIVNTGFQFGSVVRKVFVADGDALAMPTSNWLSVLSCIATAFPNLTRVSCYATARNLLEKSPGELAELRGAGLKQVYIGPESGHDVVLKNLVKGATAQQHIEAAQKAKEAGIVMSAIFLLGCGGVELSEEHAVASATLATKMDPEFLSCLTLTLVPGTPLERLAKRGRFVLPPVSTMMQELRMFVALAEPPSGAVFRTNHASNYLALGGTLPHDRDRILAALDAADRGDIPLRSEALRGL